MKPKLIKLTDTQDKILKFLKAFLEKKTLSETIFFLCEYYIKKEKVDLGDLLKRD